MSDSPNLDSILEAIIRERAGAGAPADLRERLVKAIAADAARVRDARRRRTSTALLVVAAAIAVGGGVLTVGGSWVDRPAPSLAAPSQEGAIASSSASPSATRPGSVDVTPPIVFGGESGDIGLIDATSAETTVVSSDSLSGRRQVMWSEDHSRILVSGRTALSISPNGSEPMEVVSSDRLTLRGLPWAPDGRVVAGAIIGADGRTVTAFSVVGVDGREVARIAIPPGEWTDGVPYWAPGSSSIAFITCSTSVCGGDTGDGPRSPNTSEWRTWTVWVAATDGSAPVPVMREQLFGEGFLGQVGLHDPAWAPDGQSIALLRDGCVSSPCRDPASSALVLVDVANGASASADTVLATAPAWARIGPPAWSPQGTRLAFWSNDTSGQPLLRVIGADGSTAEPLLGPHGVGVSPVGWLAWSPDGSSLASGGTALWMTPVVGGGPDTWRDLGVTLLDWPYAPSFDW